MNTILEVDIKWLSDAFTQKEQNQLKQLLEKAEIALEKKNEES